MMVGGGGGGGRGGRLSIRSISTDCRVSLRSVGRGRRLFESFDWYGYLSGLCAVVYRLLKKAYFVVCEGQKA